MRWLLGILAQKNPAILFKRQEALPEASKIDQTQSLKHAHSIRSQSADDNAKRV
jgi:hypothetical protein